MSSIKALLQAKYSLIGSRFRVVVAWLLGFALIQPGVTQEVEDQVSDIVSEATEEAQSPLGNGDAQFRQLFASWQTLQSFRVG